MVGSALDLYLLSVSLLPLDGLLLVLVSMSLSSLPSLLGCLSHQQVQIVRVTWFLVFSLCMSSSGWLFSKGLMLGNLSLSMKLVD